MKKNHVTDSCGNIFLDLGFSEKEAEHLLRQSKKRMAKELTMTTKKKDDPQP